MPLIKKWEGFSRRAYKCSAGVWTWGYGETMNVDINGQISEEEASELLSKRLERDYIEPVLRLSPSLINYPHRLAAVSSFAYNCGVDAYRKSTMRKKIDKGRFGEASKEFDKWNKAKGKILTGLVNRRADERKLFDEEDA